jgi:trimethylamine--corrinoid protein Co-methyltransferase
LDQQCGIEVALSLMTALLHGANIVHDVGFMDSGLQGSLQLHVIANDTIGWLRAATAGVPVGEEALALDVVDEMGPTGNYLSHDHTLRHFKEPFYSRLVDKGPYSQWMERGATTMEDRAAQEVDRILSSHQPQALPANVKRDIKKIVEREQAWIDSRR